MMELLHARDLLLDLGLPASSEILDNCLNDSTRSESTYLSFLVSLLEAEQKVRKKRSLETRLKLSRLPRTKNLESFDFTFQESIDERQIKELANLSFVSRHENLFFLGPPGVGKSHLGIAICLEAIKNGLSAYFTSLDRLLADLSKAQKEGRLSKRWRVYTRPHILMVDEIGYARMNRETGNLFFQLVCRRYEEGSMILTSNKGFAEWGELMGDTPLATATLDRLLHHAQVINIRGNSYRMKDRIKVGGIFTPAPPLELKEKTQGGQF